MKIFDCFMYFDEDIVLDVRLNTLHEIVDYFIIVESKFNHKGEKRNLKFDYNNFSKFKDQIIYLVYENEPSEIKKINKDDTEDEKSSKSILNAIYRENGQRNFISKGLKNADDDDFVLISDVDEIPNLKDRNSKIETIISQFELDAVTRVPAKFLSGGERKKLTIALALLSNPKVLLLDEPFAALDVLTIKMLKELIVNLQTQSNLSVVICDHQARDLLTCVDLAIVLSNGRVVAKDTPNNLVNNINAKNAYFGDNFKFN